MKIFDCTTYFDEELIMDIRFHVLNEYVHKFIVVESKYSHSGKKKELKFNIENYKKFKDKIIYLVIEDQPNNLVPLENNSTDSGRKRMNSIKRVEQSYNFMINGISDASSEDLIILSDNDEIPNLNSEQFKKSKKDIIIFKQLFFYYKLNLLYDYIPWFGSKACKKKYLKSFSWLKNLKNKKYPMWRIDAYFSYLKETNLEIIGDGGWHFTNLKTPQELFEKLSNYGHHNEFEDLGTTVEDLKNQIENKIVLYNHKLDKKENRHDNFQYKLKKIDESYLPEYLGKNKDKYKIWFD